MSNGKFTKVFGDLFEAEDRQVSISDEIEGILTEHLNSVKSDLESTLKNREISIKNSIVKGMKKVIAKKPKGKFDNGHMQDLFYTGVINYNLKV